MSNGPGAAAPPQPQTDLLPLAPNLDAALKQAVAMGASDIHIRAGHPARVRLHGSMMILEGYATPNPNDTASIAARILYQARRREKEAIMQWVRELLDEDCSFSVPGGRFRVNLCRQRGSLEVVLRVVPERVPDLDSLGLPEALKDIAMEERGLVLVTGVTGSGKSTTLAAMVHHINTHRKRKVVTIE
ncbi:MAG: ATPase, T2SS/T4P/T4SS family, partial [Acidobacteriota bacterium]